MSDLRVINLGLPKSGTTTLARALRRAVFHTADYRIRAKQTSNPALHDRFVGELIYDGYFETGDPLHYMPDFRGFSEISVLRDGLSLWPQTDFGVIDAIRHHYPNTKFVASWRPAADIAGSMLRWSNLASERLPQNAIPGLPEGYGATDAARIQWINAHYAFLDRIFAGTGCYLKLDMGAANAKATLAKFLGRKVPWWGQINRSPRPKSTIASKAAAKQPSADSSKNADMGAGTGADTGAETGALKTEGL